MADTHDAQGTSLSKDDKKVFQLLNEAQEQYEEYLAITQAAMVIFPAETPSTPPSTDIPLSLTIWPDR